MSETPSYRLVEVVVEAPLLGGKDQVIPPFLAVHLTPSLSTSGRTNSGEVGMIDGGLGLHLPVERERWGERDARRRRRESRIQGRHNLKRRGPIIRN